MSYDFSAIFLSLVNNKFEHLYFIGCKNIILMNKHDKLTKKVYMKNTLYKFIN